MRLTSEFIPKEEREVCAGTSMCDGSNRPRMYFGSSITRSRMQIAASVGLSEQAKEIGSPDVYLATGSQVVQTSVRFRSRSVHSFHAPNKAPEPTTRPARVFARSVVFGVVAGVAHLYNVGQRKMRNLWFEIYLGIGAIVVIVTLLWRLCRPSGESDSSLVWAVFGSHWIGALLVIAAWPIVVPYIVWSYRRFRAGQRFIRHDENP